MGYRLICPTEMIFEGEKRRFLEHIELKLSSPKAALEKDLMGFLERNKIRGKHEFSK